MNRLFLSTIAICAVTIAYSQTQAPFQGPLTNMKGSDYKFTIIKSLDANAVQNQNQTSTCWSFSSLSFFESELIRMGKGKEFNL
jgi:bleomycin hydrolase